MVKNEITEKERNLLFHIGCLCNKLHNYCFAHNLYFAKLFGVSERSIRRRLTILKKLGYITVENEHTKKRKIYISKEKFHELFFRGPLSNSRSNYT